MYRLITDSRTAVNVRIGQICVSYNGEYLKTALGSCIATVLYDNSSSNLASMSHFLLPLAPPHIFEESRDALRYANLALARQIESFFDLVDPNHVEAMIFGGARVFRNSKSPLIANIGRDNYEQARSILCSNAIPIVEDHVGGNQSRMVLFDPLSKKARVAMGGMYTVLEAPGEPAKG